MNIKTPDYKAQAENLRATLLSYIDCMQEVQIENEELKLKLKKLEDKIHDLETILNIYEGRKHD